MRTKPTLVGLALALTLAAGSACSSTTEPTTTAASSTPGSTTASTTGSTAGTTKASTGSTTRGGTSPDEAIDNLPVGETERTCLKDKINADPTLKTIAESSKTPTKAEATKFVNLMLSCMSRADLTLVLTANQNNPDSAESKCQSSKIAQLDEEQIAGFLSQDPATIAALQPDFKECAALGSGTTKP